MKILTTTLLSATLIFAATTVNAQQGIWGQGGAAPGQTFSTNPAAQAQPAQAAPAQYGQPVQQYQQPQSPRQGAAPVAGAPTQQARSTDSKFVILEFSDLECPDSARYATSLKPQIMQRFVNTGQASYQWRDFPLESHPMAPAAAAAARCAGPKADAVRQMMLQSQGGLNPGMFGQYAASAGVNPQEFQQCVASGKTASEVESDKALGRSMGVRGTPTLVVATSNGGKLKAVSLIKAHQGSPAEVMAQIDRAMAESR